MNFKVVLRAVVVLAILFVMLYVGMYNTQRIDFYFPIALQHKLTESAGLIYFGVFAVGFLAGTVLTAGGGKKSSGGGSRDK
jgi:uncharacterized membrane protein YciS (DUF1049 family)